MPLRREAVIYRIEAHAAGRRGPSPFRQLDAKVRPQSPMACSRDEPRSSVGIQPRERIQMPCPEIVRSQLRMIEHILRRCLRRSKLRPVVAVTSTRTVLLMETHELPRRQTTRDRRPVQTREVFGDLSYVAFSCLVKPQVSSLFRRWSQKVRQLPAKQLFTGSSPVGVSDSPTAGRCESQ